MNLALFNLNLRSSNWLGVQIVPFCDLNKLPPTYCLETMTDSASGKTKLKNLGLTDDEIKALTGK